MGLNNTI